MNNQADQQTRPSLQTIRTWIGRTPFLKDSTRTILQILPLVISLVLLGGICYTPVLLGQAIKSADDDRAQIRVTRVLTGTPGALILEVVYPREARLNPTDQAGQPMSFWIVEPTQRPGISPTSTVVPTVSVNITPTPTPTPNPYVLVIDPDKDKRLQENREGLTFNNKDGLPAALRIALTPASYVITPSTLYVRRAPGDVVPSVPITLRLYGPDNNPFAPPLSIEIQTEGQLAAYARYFLIHLLGPTTPLLGIAATLVAFAVKWYEERVKEKRSRLAEIEQVRLLASSGDLVEALDRFSDIRHKTKETEEWKDDEIVRRVDEVWQVLNAKPWKRAALSRAARSLAEKNYGDARLLVEHVLEFDSADLLAKDMNCVIEFSELRGTTPPDTLAPLLRIHKEYPDLLCETIGNLLAELIQRDDGKCALELASSELARDLLRVRNLELALDSLKKKTPFEAVKSAIQGLLEWRKQVRYKVIGWRETRPADPPQLRSWLGLAGLEFDPFGPDAAEFDPRLPTFAVYDAVGEIRGVGPALVLGAPGSGKTATALLLAHDCFDPLENPREPYALPFYYVPRLEMLPSSDHCACLNLLTHAVADFLTCYLTASPEDLLDLMPSRQERLGKLLLTCAGSRKQLIRKLQDAAINMVDSRMLDAIEHLDPDVHAVSKLDEQAWLDLLEGALPNGFLYLYLLTDIPDVPKGSEAAIVPRLRSLLELSTPLASLGIHLKLFAPEVLRPHLGGLDRLIVTTLTWSKQSLQEILRQRIIQVSDQEFDSLEALCDQSAQGMQVDKLLIDAAKTPRELIRLGNQLLKIHVERAHNEPLLSAEDIQLWMLPTQDNRSRIWR